MFDADATLFNSHSFWRHLTGWLKAISLQFSLQQEAAIITIITIITIIIMFSTFYVEKIEQWQSKVSVLGAIGFKTVHAHGNGLYVVICNY